ncbi:hypothetical protein [Haloarchaeobius sp. HME9146]|nr:hypothetical protein [Haloarchaeobius sp. HME9146]MCT9096805.1 hypothetical protein [Haloarchaeobius sp. HME9146]
MSDGRMDELESLPPVRANETSPGRVVFCEHDNSDGWIATDFTVDADP